MKRFRTPGESLDALDADKASTLIAAASDVALVLDERGIIRDVAVNSEDRTSEWAAAWLGRPWIDTVTKESRPKVEALLREAAALDAARPRHVNHPSSWGADVPVMYSAMRIGSEGRVVAFGRDLSSTATLQQQLVNAQLSMERDYGRLRHLETRYRLLFQTTTEGVLVLDASTLKVIEANPAAGRLIGIGRKRPAGRHFPEGFDPAGTAAIEAMLAAVRATGRADTVEAMLLSDGRKVEISASLFSQEQMPLFLVRLATSSTANALMPGQAQILKAIEAAPDGFVLTDGEGRIISVNTAFLDLVEVAAGEGAEGESLDRWLGRPGVDLDVLLATMRQHGKVRLYQTTLRGDYGATSEVEVSAVAVTIERRAAYGFIVRDVGRRLRSEAGTSSRELPRSVEQLTELVGRVPLKDLVRETTDVIERLCIEAALELTNDNRASAAEILGLSRQSLYVKLRRYGLGDLAGEVG